jgi:Zn-dependent protease with chaperone function
MQRVLFIIVLLLASSCVARRERSWTIKELSQYRGDRLTLEDSRGDEFSVRLNIVRELEAVVQRLREPLKNIVDVDAEVLIVEDAEPNAFSGYRGKRPVIMITRGLLAVLDNDINEYAFVISHEMSHWAWGHPQSSHVRSKIVRAITTGLLYVPNPIVAVTADFAVQVVDMKFSRDQEREADDLGIELMMLADYDPWGAVRYRQKVLKFGVEPEWAFLSTHPGGAERIERMRAKIAAGKPKIPSYEVRPANTD